MPKIIVTSRYLKSSSKKKLKNYVKYIATREGVINTISERKNYVGYLANRPNSHGLFNEKDEPINLEKTAKEIADHRGNVWSHVVSLRRDNAQKMGYDNLNAWRDLVLRQIPSIAKNQKIDLKNMRWYAAFHDKETNPHVHIIVYSEDEREGFLTNHGIEKIRSGFANDIYYDELHHLYEQQTNLRNLLKKESEQLMKSLAEKISQDQNFDVELINLVAKLRTQLAESKGKKVYGYLKQDVKKTVNEIFTRLADNESVRKMYDLWCEMEQQKHDVYSSAKVNFPDLVDNKEFRSVKNMIIQTVMKMKYPNDDIEFGSPEIMTQEDLETLVKQADSGDAFSCYKLGKIYLQKENYDIEKAIFYFEKSADKNMWSGYQLGRLYFFGAEDLEKNKEKAMIYLNLSAEQGNEYAQGIIDNTEKFENEMLVNTVFSLFINLSRCIEDNYHHKFQSGRKMIDSKLKRVIQEKKQALGIKQEQNFEQSYSE
ncbi:MAG: relaxase MobL [Alistipes sp.]|nr:relaxase MobL [Alistipes sp.]